MQTELAAFVRGTPQGAEAEDILRRCVHCGFCTATCPTYQLLGDELDGPRGRIYLVKQLLEGAAVGERTRLHLDRCLTCRSCETTCPSGVRYGRLADIGRAIVEVRAPRPLWQRLQRGLLAFALPRTRWFSAALSLGQALAPVLPGVLRAAIPPRARTAGVWPAARHARRMLVLAGCVQPALAPRINAAAARVLDRLGISLVEVASTGCCGAVRYHLNRQDDGLDDARALIDAWWPLLAAGDAESIVMTASGCGAMVHEYGDLLRNDPAYCDKARLVSERVHDLSEVVAAELDRLPPAEAGSGERIAVHSPCTLQHALGVRGTVERALEYRGYELAAVPDGHLCCGSAGTYSILQPDLSRQLRARKIAALESDAPVRIVTANIGCLTHLGGASRTPVQHWIELLDDGMSTR